MRNLCWWLCDHAFWIHTCASSKFWPIPHVTQWTHLTRNYFYIFIFNSWINFLKQKAEKYQKIKGNYRAFQYIDFYQISRPNINISSIHLLCIIHCWELQNCNSDERIHVHIWRKTKNYIKEDNMEAVILSFSITNQWNIYMKVVTLSCFYNKLRTNPNEN